MKFETESSEVQTLRSLRLSRNMDVVDVIEELNVSKPYLYMIERGIRKPGDKIKRKLVKLYGVSMDELYEVIDNTQANI